MITSNYYGYSDIENQVEADASTVYEWGSCSKLLVWTAVMQQCERGNIDLDTDIRAYLPEGFLTKLQYEDEKITMVQVLGHGGNTGGCSSMLKFDPESGLGLVIMTNEPGETMFNYGIPNLIFGKITDRAEFKCVELQDENDISGIYLSKRTIDTGAACFPDKWNYFRL
ncbi:MAG: serine hydrolase domain-containing protein [Agathobacter sp.]|nr:serine hydrolase domain-containing protein [Agathobacter sp.]